MCEVKHYLPHTRVAEVTYKTYVSRVFNLRQNGDSLPQKLDDTETLLGQQMTTNALGKAIPVLIERLAPSCEKFMILFTNDKENDNDYSYDLESCLDNYAIKLILIVKTTSTIFETTCIFADTNCSIFVKSIDTLNDYTGDVKSLLSV